MSLKKLNKAGKQYRCMKRKVFLYNLKVLKDFKYVLPFHFKKFIAQNNGIYLENETEGYILLDKVLYYLFLEDGKIKLSCNVEYFTDKVGNTICMA